MAKSLIKAGAEIDVLTRDELHTELVEVASGYLRPPQDIRFDAGGVIDGTTYLIAFDVYKPELGYKFRLTRLTINLSGYTFGTPYTAAGSYFEILRGGQVLDGLNLDVTSAGFQLPYVYTESDSRAIFCQDGELLQLKVVGDNTVGGATVSCHGQGILLPLSPLL